MSRALHYSPLAVILLVMVFLGVSLSTQQAQAQVDPTYQPGFFEGPLCGPLGWLVRPLGLCDRILVTPPAPAAPEIVVQALAPTTPVAPQPSATTSVSTNSTTTVIERVIERVPVNEYITNEYVTNPTTVVQEVVEREIIREESRRQDMSGYVEEELFDKQVDSIYESIGDSFSDLKSDFETDLLTVTGSLRDSTLSAGLSGMVLQSTGTGVEWVATSSLGISGGGGGGGSSLFTDGGATTYLTSLTDNLAIGTTTATAKLTVAGEIDLVGVNTNAAIYNQGVPILTGSTTNNSFTLGTFAGSAFTADNDFNVAIGYYAGYLASTTGVDNNNYIGYLAGGLSSGERNNFLGYAAGYESAGNTNIAIGSFTGMNNTGDQNIMLGTHAGRENAGLNNSMIGRNAGRYNTGDENVFLGYQAGSNVGSSNSVYVGGYAMAGSALFEVQNNVVVGYRAGHDAVVGASNNVLIGYQAADNITSGANNLVIGNDIDIASSTASGQLNIGNAIFGTGLTATGTDIFTGNIGIGTSSPNAKLTVAGDVNIADPSSGISFMGTRFFYASSTNDSITIGEGAGTQLTALTTDNVAIGRLAMSSVTSGSGNTAIGGVAGEASQGNFNTLLGYFAGDVNNGSYNVSIGESAGSSIVGDYNTYIGSVTGYGAVGDNNIAIGFAAGDSLNGEGNLILGHNAGNSLTAGSRNTLIGYDVEAASSTGSNQLNIGNLIFGTGVDGTGTILSSGNIGIGTSSPNAKLTVAGDINIATSSGSLNFQGVSFLKASSVNNSISFGANAASSFSSGDVFNVALGGFSMQNATNTDYNVAVGYQALQNSSGHAFNSYNVALGYRAGRNNQADNSIFIGTGAGADNTGYLNTLIGSAAGQYMTGNQNVALGEVSGLSVRSYGGVFIGTSAGQATIYGEEAVLVGANTGLGLDGATSSVAIGASALGGSLGANNSFAENTVAIGYEAGASVGLGADNNVLIGYRAGESITTGDNNIVLGYDIDISGPTVSNELNIGNLLFGTGVDGTGTILSSGNIGIGTSSPNAKLSVAGNINVAQTYQPSPHTGDEAFVFSGQLDASTDQNNVLTSFTNTGSTTCASDDYCNEGHLGLFTQTNGSDYHRRYIKFGAVDDVGARSFDWYTGANASHQFILFDALENSHRARYTSGGDTLFNASDGANRIVINRELGGEQYGTDGLTVYDGTSNILFDIDGTGIASIGGNNVSGRGLTVSGQFTAVRGQNDAGSTNMELVRDTALISSGQILGQHQFRGTASGEKIGVCISGTAAGTWNAGDAPSRLEFATRNVGDGSCVERMRIDQIGNVGIGTTSITQRLTVDGNMRLTGALYDSTNSAGTNGMVLQTTGAGTQWVATSSLGISGGAGGTTDFLSLTDTPSSYSAGSLLFTSGSAVTQDNSNLFWDDSSNSLGIGTSTPNKKLHVFGGGIRVEETYQPSLEAENEPFVFTGQLATDAGSSRVLTSFTNTGSSTCLAEDYCNESHLALFSQTNGSDFHRRYIKFGGISGTGARTFDWYTGANAGNTFILYDAENAQHRMRVLGNSDTSINAGTGANRIIFNRTDGVETYGTDGLTVYDGGTNILFDIDGSGIASIGGNNVAGRSLTTTGQFVALRGQNDGGSTFEMVRTDADSTITSGNDLGNVQFRGIDDTEEIGACIKAAAAGTWSTDVAPSRLMFGTSGVADDNCDERMRIDQLGRMAIGTTSPQSLLTVAGVITPDANNTYSLGNSTYRWSEVFASNGVINTSDERLKENIASSTYGLSELLALSPVSFTWIDAPEQGTKLGLLAQDVQLVLPEIVQEGDDEDKTLGVRYTEIIPVIINSIKELWETVTGNKDDIEALQKRIEALESELDITTAEVEEADPAADPDPVDQEDDDNAVEPEEVTPTDAESATSTASTTEEVLIEDVVDEEAEEADEVLDPVDPETTEEEVVDVVEPIEENDEPEETVEEIPNSEPVVDEEPEVAVDSDPKQIGEE